MSASSATAFARYAQDSVVGIGGAGHIDQHLAHQQLDQHCGAQGPQAVVGGRAGLLAGP
jgi:hypothetical protein